MIAKDDLDDPQDVLGVSISRAATRYSRVNSLPHDDSDITPGSEDEVAWPRHVEETSQEPSLRQGRLPSPKPQQVRLPSPWRAEPRAAPERSDASRSVLRDALGSGRKKRSSSWGTADLKKLLPSMPSLAAVGHLVPGFSSHRQNTRRGSSASVSPSPSPAPTSIGLESDVTEPKQLAQRPRMLRRMTSDQSILYHTLSRTSSLGDDSRWDDHHEMVNSRVKAIRDSLQDRSSFRLPSLPSLPAMPSMPNLPNLPTSPVLQKALNYLHSKPLYLHTNRKIYADDSGFVPGTKKRTSPIGTDTIVDPAVVAAAPTVPEPSKQASNAVTNPPRVDAFENCLHTLTGDIVIMGGYRGSILRSAQPPHRQLWVPVKVGLNIRKVDLEVGLEPEDEERMEETIFASGMLSHIGPVDISRRLFKRLQNSENARNGTLRIWDYGWDWRLSPALSSRKLEAFLASLPCNSTESGSSGALVIAHSLGGLITRHVVNRRPELFSGVIYAGTPQACVNILGPLRNGDAVLMSQRVLTAQVNFTLRTSFALLPLEGYCFEDKFTGEKIIVDYFNVDDWIKYRFSPCTDPPLPPKNLPQPSGFTGILKTASFTNLPILNRRKGSSASIPHVPVPRDARNTPHNPSPESPAPSPRDNLAEQQNTNTESRSMAHKAADTIEDAVTTDHSIAPQMSSLTNPVQKGQSTNSSVSTLVTIPRDKAIAYLRRTLAETKQFKLELAHKPELTSANRYPPFAVIYGKSIPTVNAAKVDGRDAIARADCYDDLGFGSGDGVCLAVEAQLPEGYRCAKGGRINSDRGHVTLLGDLNAVGRAIEAVSKGRAKGIGRGNVGTKTYLKYENGLEGGV